MFSRTVGKRALRFFRSLIAVPVFCSALLVGTAWGATGENGLKNATGADALRLDSVTVTANKMEEDVADVPQSISVISDIQLEEHGIKDIADVISLIPNMNFIPDHGNEINIRGLNASFFTHNNPVVIYIDGVPTSGRQGFDFSMANVERIEVLRGPQGTLYGKDAIGGVINVVTKDPTNAWHGKVGAEYGSFNMVRGLANVSGPVVEDKFFVGLNSQYEQDQGWIKNDYPGMNEDANRKRDLQLNGYLLYTPTDRLRMRFSVTHGFNKRHWRDEYGLPAGTPIEDFDRDDGEHIRYDVPTYAEVEQNAQSLTASYQFDDVHLNSVTTHKNRTIHGVYDGDFSDNPVYAGLETFEHMEVESWSQEVRLSSRDTVGFRWVGGIYLDTEKSKFGPFGQQFPYFGPDGRVYGNFEMDAESTTHSNTQAVFGQVMIPALERFELTLGGRLQRVRKSIDQSMYSYPVGGSAPASYGYDTGKTWSTFLPKVALSYRIADAWNTYLSYAQGYMPGGFNTFAMGGSSEDNTFEPQTCANYEWGIKGNYDNFRMSAALFYMDIKDIHIYKSVGNLYVTGNAEKAHSQGVEFELTYLPWECLEISGSFSILQTKYDAYDTGNEDYGGEPIEEAPSHTARLGATYRHPDGFYGWGQVRNVGAVHFLDDANKEFVKEDPYTLMDLRIGYLFSDWDVYAYVSNLTDEKYITTFHSNSNYSFAGFGSPRTFGLGVLYHF
jgi:iron complex outermembrane receptor protein